MDAYMTPYQVAEILNLSRPAASRVMVRAGAVNIGVGPYQVLRITNAALTAYLEGNKAKEPEKAIAWREPSEKKKREDAKKIHPGLQRRR